MSAICGFRRQPEGSRVRIGVLVLVCALALAPLQAAVHSVISEGIRLFTSSKQTSAQRRRAMMKVFIIHFGGITQYANGILDLPNEDALVAELSAMTAGK